MLKKVPLHLQRGDPKSHEWLADAKNRLDLDIFLKTHGLDINLVAEIKFSNQNFRALVYETDDDGNKIVDEEKDAAKAEWKKVNYLTVKPTWG